MNGWNLPNLPPLNVPAEFYLLIIILRPTLNGHQIRILPHRFLWVSSVSFCWLKSVNCTCACSSAATHRRVSLAAHVVLLQNRPVLTSSFKTRLTFSHQRAKSCWWVRRWKIQSQAWIPAEVLLGSHCFGLPLNVMSHSWQYFCTRSQAQI